MQQPVPDFLQDDRIRLLLLFGGKGGVGKTTLACASALHPAQQRPRQKILLFLGLQVDSQRKYRSDAAAPNNAGPVATRRPDSVWDTP